MKKIIFFITVVLISGCTSSGVIKMGPDTYSISTYHDYSSTGAKQMAYKEANQQCLKLGKEIMTVRTNQSSQRVVGIPTSNFDLEFRCLSKGDPDLYRPTLKKEADIVIDNR
ncbi:hypothetical protein A9Q74_06435 [Colwellia sp. 39_35_sub15_T18]|nr:hypothetical protein A9Q74_06435 [Colwellia sp. 39_35_sub15_T18]